ncbi:MAG: hypothetical protein SFY66_10750 [Oculatellaceae cyanobacterium bins.114]|nr:hypothetical protein [Oculatellaceae cyanobacterium bins.114]
MISKFISVPVVALVTVLIVRGLSAPPSRQEPAIAISNPGTSPSSGDAVSANSPYLQLARDIYSQSIRSVINARAVELFTKAQESGDAIAWTDKLCRDVAGDIASLRQQYGTVTGEAVQYGELLNRTAELSACLVAYHWVVNGGVASDQTTVNPSALIQAFEEVLGNADY